METTHRGFRPSRHALKDAVGSMRVIQGDCLDVLRQLHDESVHVCLTSPPYYGLRDYETAPTVWGGDPACAHQWASERRLRVPPKRDHTHGGYTSPTGTRGLQKGKRIDASLGNFCCSCGAWRGALGLEPDPFLYAEHLVEVFREVRRVLRRDGVAFVNLGDGYAANRSYQAPSTKGEPKHSPAQAKNDGAQVPRGMKPKDLLGVPWMTAFALRADGWWLRQGIVWAKGTSGVKPMEAQVAEAMLEVGCSETQIQDALGRLDPYVGNSMPESVRDRCTQSHEYIFLLTKSAGYHFDGAGVREGAVSDHNSGNGFARPARLSYVDSNGPRGNPKQWIAGPQATRNLRSVWTIPTRPFKGAHFAVMSPLVAELALRAATGPGGCCAACGVPRVRVVRALDIRPNRRKPSPTVGRHDQTTSTGWLPQFESSNEFRPACRCNAPTAPMVVLDPFCGAGTTGVQALKLGHSFVGIELNPEYAELARRRIAESVADGTPPSGSRRYAS